MMANLLYLYQVEPQMTDLFAQKMNIDLKLIKSFKEGLSAAYLQNFSISQEDQEELHRVMEEHEDEEHKGKTLDLVQLELFLICLENIDILVKEVHALKDQLESLKNQRKHADLLFSAEMMMPGQNYGNVLVD